MNLTATAILVIIISCVIILILNRVNGKKHFGRKKSFETEGSLSGLPILKASDQPILSAGVDRLKALEAIITIFNAGLVGVNQLPADPLTGIKQPTRYDVLISVAAEGKLDDVVRKFKLLGYSDDRDWSVAREKSGLEFVRINIPPQWDGKIDIYRLLCEVSTTDQKHLVGWLFGSDSSLTRGGELINLMPLRQDISSISDICRKLKITDMVQIQSIYNYVTSNPYSASLFSLTNEIDSIGIYFGALNLQGLRKFMTDNHFDQKIVQLADPRVIIKVGQRFRKNDVTMKSLLASFYAKF